MITGQDIDALREKSFEIASVGQEIAAANIEAGRKTAAVLTAASHDVAETMLQLSADNLQSQLQQLQKMQEQVFTMLHQANPDAAATLLAGVTYNLDAALQQLQSKRAA